MLFTNFFPLYTRSANIAPHMQTSPFDCLPLFNKPFVFRTEADFCIYFPITSCCHKRIPLPYTSCLTRQSLFCLSRNLFLFLHPFYSSASALCHISPRRPPWFHMYSFIQRVSSSFTHIPFSHFIRVILPSFMSLYRYLN